MEELIIKMESMDDEKQFVKSVKTMPVSWLKHYYKMLREHEYDISYRLEADSDNHTAEEHDKLVETELDCLVMIMALARVLYSKNVDVHLLDMEAIAAS